jgi:glycerate kinase
MRVLACPDKFRGTATAGEAAAAISAAVIAHGGTCVERPLADGGEGTLEALGGPNRRTEVTGPLGAPVVAEWRLRDGVAVIEMARASGLLLAGGAEGNDPLDATTTGTGELIAAAVEAGARRVLVGVGGSATTDGGLGALRAMAPLPRFRGVDIEVACDVRTRFIDAAEVFAPQKGASDAQVALLRRRLERLAAVYLAEHEVDVAAMDMAGAAGGLAGGLAAIGARLREGFQVVADELELYDLVEEADLVITGEGRLDASSFDGKVVGGVASLAADAGVPVLAVVGAAAADVRDRIDVIDLTASVGEARAMTDTVAGITELVGVRLAAD